MPRYLTPLIIALLLTSPGCLFRTQTPSSVDPSSQKVAQTTAPTPWPKINESTYPMVLPRGKVDYKKLDSLLSEQNWRGADEETWQVMLRAARQAKIQMNENFIVRFPCKDLMTIDQLWVNHSNGHFGFSVQKRIWEGIGGPTKMAGTSYETSIQLLESFTKRVPWNRKNTTINLSSPEGYLPVVGFRGIAFGGKDWWIFSLVERLESCKMFLPPNDQVFVRIEPPGSMQRRKQSEAKQYIYSMNKGQEVHYLYKSIFGTTIEELGIGIKAETENYKYEIVVGADQRQAMATATAKNSELTSFTGIVFVVDRNGSKTIVSEVCETKEPSTLPPPSPKFPQGNGEIECPSGSRSR